MVMWFGYVRVCSLHYSVASRWSSRALFHHSYRNRGLLFQYRCSIETRLLSAIVISLLLLVDTVYLYLTSFILLLLRHFIFFHTCIHWLTKFGCLFLLVILLILEFKLRSKVIQPLVIKQCSNNERLKKIIKNCTLHTPWIILILIHYDTYFISTGRDVLREVRVLL